MTLIGEPVEWNVCLVCHAPMGDEERYRAEKDGKVGIGHKECTIG
jgi:hypothetical protein